MSSNFGSFVLPSGSQGGMNFGSGSNMGSNQYMTFPQSYNSSFQIPTSFNNIPSGPPSGGPNPNFTGTPPPYMQELPSGQYTSPTLDPALSSSYANFLQGQIGQGLSAYPGQLNAPLDPTLQSLQQFYMTGQGGPLPGVLPMWQSELAAFNAPGGPNEQNLANIQEQFGSRGALGSSEAARAFADYGVQTAANENSLLGQLTLQALPGMQSFGQGMQNLDQQSLNNLYQEWLRTQPAYSPYLPMIQSIATTFPGTTPPKQSIGQAILGGVGDLAQMAGTLLPFTGV